MRATTNPDQWNQPTRVLTRKQVVDLLRRGQSLEKVDVRGLDLSGLNFDGVNLRWTKLADANLQRCSFKGADLSNASMWHANLKDASFEQAVLDFADLDCANLDGATFLGARIKKTIFPFQLLPIEVVEQSVRTGVRVRMKDVDLGEEF